MFLNKLLNSWIGENQKFNFKIFRYFKKFYRTPKNCILCETWVFYKAPLCKPCRKYLYQEYLKTEFAIKNVKNYPCYFLWRWTNSNDLWIQKLIVSMKDGDNYALYEIFMPWLVKKMRVYSDLSWVSAIPSLNRKHPQALLFSFMKLYVDVKKIDLLKVSQKAQKFRSKKERQETTFQIKEPSDYKFVRNKDKILILDDVLATGGSFRGVLAALEGKNIQALAVWAYRDKRNF